MTYRVIEIPGGSTKYDDAPSIHIAAGSGSFATVVIRYISGMSRGGQSPPLAEIIFSRVIEYRWIHEDYYYVSGGEAAGFRLIEIIDSKYVEEMAANSPWRRYPGKRFGPFIPESDVRHFRLPFDDYGVFDIIALGVSVREMSK